MKLTIIIIIFFTNIHLFAADYVEVGKPIIHVFTQNDYNSHQQNWDIEQADNQLIYIANGNGLLEFDGQSWTNYSTPNRSRIREIKIVGDRIYAGTSNDLGYYQANKEGVLIFHSLLDRIEQRSRHFGDIMSVVSLGQYVVFKAVNYYFIYDGKNLKTIEDKTQSRNKLIKYKNKIYVKNSNDERVYNLSFESDSFLTASAWELPKSSQIKQILTLNDNRVVVFTGKSGVFTGTDDGLEKLDLPKLDGVFIYDAIKSTDGFYYLATINKGLFILSSELKIVKNYRDFHGLQMNAITAVFNDKQSNLWLVGNGAIAVMRPPNEISAFAKSDNVYSHKLKYINNKLSYLGRGILQLEQNKENQFYPWYFEKIKTDDDEFWNSVDTIDYSFFATSNGVEIGQIMQGELIHQLISENKIFNYDIAATQDRKHVFVASDKGLYHVWKEGENWVSGFVKGLESEVNALLIENNETLWIGTSSPLLYRVDIQSILNQKPVIQQFNQKDGIGNNKVVPFFTETLSVVFATNDGVMRYSGNVGEPLKFVEKMPDIFHTKDEDAHLLYDDLDGRLWYRIGSHSGYAYKEQDSWKVHEALFNYFPRRSIDSFATQEHNIMWFMLASNEVFRVNVEKASQIPAIAPLHIRTINDSKESKVIQAGVLSKLIKEIPNENNSIRIHYALADYSIIGKNSYRVRMLGSQNEQWGSWSNETYKDFTQLSGSNYTFQVQAKDGFGRESQVASLDFIVLPPFYLSKLALLLYAIAALALLVITAWLVQKWRTKKLKAHNIHLANLVNQKTQEIEGHIEQLEQQQELKTRFFTNISHELRTPLSLIILPLQKLIEINKSQLDKEAKKLLTLSLKNANDMKGLVSHVLDVSRYEQKEMPIVAQKSDLYSFVENMSQAFVDWAAENQQKIKIIKPQAEIELYFDRQIMEKILSNLLSNAIKYSGRGTIITLSLFANKTHAGIQINDNGVGIEQSQCMQVFERYFKSDNHNAEYDSSGIGLAFVKEMVELHQGTIELHSDKGQGCKFTLTFKIGFEHFNSYQFQQQAQELDKLDDSHPEDTAVIMIVEDNNDLRSFIAQSLAVDYKIIQAINGIDALQTLTHELPDLIISDIMMPQMDGIEFLQQLRQQEQFKTVPFFLLSSKSTQSDTQIGLQYGADDYLTKPFDMEELLLRVKNIINSRKLIRKEVQNQINEITKQDKVELSLFEEKLRNVILRNISDSHFNVTSLAQIFGLDRTAFFRKTKKELNISPSKYIQLVRLEIAEKLLNKGGITVSEVAYASGFESLSYFSKTFKNKYGKLPSHVVN
jgi:signal transduction histidine kinase/CheY-like chemotaxis protein